ncbi:MAG: FAD-binding oxidoreductase [Candidatus Helarchaeota archaeon]|nr:FAD-binding oxidoreductase [Candidatus Helarchaeota archaeon]
MEILQPKNAQELAKLIKWLDSDPSQIDFSENKGISSIDKGNLTITLKTGTTWRELISYLKAINYEPCIYPKKESITLEEWLQTDGINLAGFKFGLTGRSLYDVEMVTYQGEITNLGFKTTLYDALGYELKRIFLGSQFILGISTECTMQIRKVPETKLALKLTLTPTFNIKELLEKFNRKSLRPTLIFFTQTDQVLILYILLDGAIKIVAAESSVISSVLSGYAGFAYDEVTENELLGNLYEPDGAALTYYLIAPEKLGELIQAFQLISKAYIINQNTIMVGLDLNKLNIPESAINSKILELRGKKVYIHPLNTEELMMFGEKSTPELIQKIRKSFDPTNFYERLTREIKKEHEKLEPSAKDWVQGVKSED